MAAGEFVLDESLLKKPRHDAYIRAIACYLALQCLPGTPSLESVVELARRFEAFLLE